MPTVKQVIERAFGALGVVGDGQELSASDAQTALYYLQSLLESWSTENLLVPQLTHEDFTLTGARSYSIGPGGDFDTIRPLSIQDARIRRAGGIESPLTLASLNLWTSISNKDTGETVPVYLYYNAAFPLGQLEFSGLTTTGDTLKLVSTKPIAAITSLTADMTFPPGYERAIRLGLAIEMAAEYGVSISAEIAATYKASFDNLKRLNSQTRATAGTLQVDGGLLSSGYAYDINSGPY